jgi:hypothetical protein
MTNLNRCSCAKVSYERNFNEIRSNALAIEMIFRLFEKLFRTSSEMFFAIRKINNRLIFNKPHLINDEFQIVIDQINNIIVTKMTGSYIASAV